VQFAQTRSSFQGCQNSVSEAHRQWHYLVIADSQSLRTRPTQVKTGSGREKLLFCVKSRGITARLCLCVSPSRAIRRTQPVLVSCLLSRFSSFLVVRNLRTLVLTWRLLLSNLFSPIQLSTQAKAAGSCTNISASSSETTLLNFPNL